MAHQVDFLLFEYWLTDHAGHRQDFQMASEVLTRFDRFLSGLLKHISLDSFTVACISDHGNIEDLSVKTHTRNAVPGIFLGRHRTQLAEQVTSLTQLTPNLVRVLTEDV